MKKKLSEGNKQGEVEHGDLDKNEFSPHLSLEVARLPRRVSRTGPSAEKQLVAGREGRHGGDGSVRPASSAALWRDGVDAAQRDGLPAGARLAVALFATQLKHRSTFISLSEK